MDRHLEALVSKLETLNLTVILRSRATWYEHGEKSTKYFLSLGKRNKAKTHVRKILLQNNLETTEHKAIMLNLKIFYSNLHKRSTSKTNLHLNYMKTISNRVKEKSQKMNAGLLWNLWATIIHLAMMVWVLSSFFSWTAGLSTPITKLFFSQRSNSLNLRDKRPIIIIIIIINTDVYTGSPPCHKWSDQGPCCKRVSTSLVKHKNTLKLHIKLQW